MLVLRKIKKQFIEKTVKNPYEKLTSKKDKKVYLKYFGRNYLKVVVSEEKDSIIVITEHWIAKKRAKK